MKTTSLLLEATKEIWSEYYKHPFVLGIQNGTLEKEKFRFYIVQDFLYLVDYTKVFAIGVAKTKNLELGKLFSKSITNLTDSEMDIHKGYMGKFNLTEEELENTEVSLDNLSYTSYMLRVAYEEGDVEILASILACGYSYELIAKNIVKNKPDSINDEFYGEWIQGYSSEEYAKANVFLLDMLDELTKNYSDKQIKHLKDIFVACSRYELDFWNMAWEMRK